MERHIERARPPIGHPKLLGKVRIHRVPLDARSAFQAATARMEARVENAAVRLGSAFPHVISSLKNAYVELIARKFARHSTPDDAASYDRDVNMLD